MSLNEEKITVSIGLDSLAYILTNEFNRGTFLEFMGRVAEVNADTNFEWEVIVVLFGRLLDSDPETAAELLRDLARVEETNAEACYTYDAARCIFFRPQGHGASKPAYVVAGNVDPELIQFIVDSLNEREA